MDDPINVADPTGMSSEVLGEWFSGAWNSVTNFFSGGSDAAGGTSDAPDVSAGNTAEAMEGTSNPAATNDADAVNRSSSNGSNPDTVWGHNINNNDIGTDLTNTYLQDLGLPTDSSGGDGDSQRPYSSQDVPEKVEPGSLRDLKNKERDIKDLVSYCVSVNANDPQCENLVDKYARYGLAPAKKAAKDLSPVGKEAAANRLPGILDYIGYGLGFKK